MKYLPTEQRNPRSERIDKVSTLEMARIINDEDQLVAKAVETQLPHIARAIDVASQALKAGHRLFYIGAGTSGRLGVLDASECPPTFGVSPDLIQGIIAGGEQALARATEASEDDAGAGVRDLLERGFQVGDVVCGIAASGRTPYVVGAIQKAAAMNCSTIGISCVPGSLLAEAVEIAITPVTGPEALTGSTRMKAGTATKMILNMISTGALIRMGYAYENLMVNVQPKNEKLLDRARRIIADACAVDSSRAAQLLEESGRSVRIAIVMGRLNLTREAAADRLAKSGDVVAKALGEVSG